MTEAECAAKGHNVKIPATRLTFPPSLTPEKCSCACGKVKYERAGTGPGYWPINDGKKQ